jgi:hypothetical protein
MTMLARHLRESNLTYFQHMIRALSISYKLLVSSVACLIHAFFPFVFETKASSTIKNLCERLEA